jgi:hypothetical protein
VQIRIQLLQYCVRRLRLILGTRSSSIKLGHDRASGRCSVTAVIVLRTLARYCTIVSASVQESDDKGDADKKGHPMCGGGGGGGGGGFCHMHTECTRIPGEDTTVSSDCQVLAPPGRGHVDLGREKSYICYVIRVGGRILSVSLLDSFRVAVHWHSSVTLFPGARQHLGTSRSSGGTV